MQYRRSLTAIFVSSLALLFSACDSGGAPNLPPKAVIAFDPPSGTASARATVNLDGSGSSDPDGRIAGYQWSVNGVFVGADEQLTHTFEAGTHDVSLQVTDDRGASHETNSQYLVNVGSPSSSGTIRFMYDGAYVPAEGLEYEITELDGRQIWIEADEPWKLTVESPWLSVDPSSGDAGITPVTLTLLGDEVERAPYATNFIYAWPRDEEPSELHEMFMALLADVPLMSEPTIDGLERKLPTGLVAYVDFEVHTEGPVPLKVELEASDPWITVPPAVTLDQPFQHGRFVVTAECGANEEVRSGSVVVSSNQPHSAPVLPVTLDCREPPPSDFDIEIVFTNGYEPTATQRRVIEQSARHWESVIVGDLPDVVTDYSDRCVNVDDPLPGEIDDLILFVSAHDDFGPTTLGRAGPCELRDGSFLPYAAHMELNAVELEQIEEWGMLAGTVMHEMGHALGIGPLWGESRLDLLEPTCVIQGGDVQFTGDLARQRHEDLLGSGELMVEGDRPGTTSCNHWEDGYGDELMTGSIGTAQWRLSAFTIGSLEDLGYEVSYEFADAYELPTPDELKVLQQAEERFIEEMTLPLER